MAKEVPMAIILTVVCFATLMANSKSLFLGNKTIVPPSFRVYLQQTLGGPNGNLYEVARASISTNTTSFGIIYVTDGVMTAGPDPNSPRLGRVQGTVTTTGLFEQADVVNYSFRFTAGKYKGSSLIVAGQRLVFVANQEIPIAGGTGFFRGARGFAVVNFISDASATDTSTVFAYDFYMVGVN